MAITNGYVTLTQLKAAVNIGDTADDAALEQAIESASREIDNHCHRRFFVDASATARVYAARWGDRLDVDDISTATDLVVKTDTNRDASFETTWAATDYQAEPLNNVSADGVGGWPFTRLRAIGSTGFPCSRQALVQVTAKWGWAAVPEPVVNACLILAEETYKLKDAPFGVAGMNDFGVVRVRTIPQVERMLGPYVRTPQAVG